MAISPTTKSSESESAAVEVPAAPVSEAAAPAPAPAAPAPAPVKVKASQGATTTSNMTSSVPSGPVSSVVEAPAPASSGFWTVLSEENGIKTLAHEIQSVGVLVSVQGAAVFIPAVRLSDELDDSGKAVGKKLFHI